MDLGDIRIALEDGEGALNIKNSDLEIDLGLETAIILSLFSDQRAEKDSIPPDGSRDLRGWWGDVTQEDAIGSKLWLLFREKVTSNTREKFKAAASASLQWMLDDGVASSIDVTIASLSEESIDFIVKVTKPALGNSINFRYYYNWQAQIFERV
jgi:phage gp46-like protein